MNNAARLFEYLKRDASNPPIPEDQPSSAFSEAYRAYVSLQNPDGGNAVIIDENFMENLNYKKTFVRSNAYIKHAPKINYADVDKSLGKTNFIYP